MSVLNQMLRDLEARAAPLPAAAASAGSHALLAMARPRESVIERAQASDRRTTRRLLWFGVTAPALGITCVMIWADQLPIHKPSPRGMAQYGAVLEPAPAATAPTIAAAADVRTEAPAAAGAAQAAARAGAGAMEKVAGVDAAAASPAAAAGPTAARPVPAGSAVAPAASGGTAASSAPARGAAAASPATTTPPAATRAGAPASPARASASAPAAAAAHAAVAGTTYRGPAAADAAAAASTSATPAAINAPVDAPVQRSAASLAESDPEVTRAAALIARGRNAEAIDLLRTLLAHRPLHADARRALAALLAEGDRRHEALVLLLEGAALDPPRFALRAAQLQHELGDAAGALATLERVPPARRSGAQHALAGGIALRLGDAGAAIGAYRQALAAADAQPVWWIGLALAQEAGGQLGAARESLARVARDPALDDELRRFIAQRLAALPPAAAEGTPVAGMLR